MSLCARETPGARDRASRPEGATKADVTLRLDGTDLPAVYISDSDHRGLKQINAMLPANMEPGEYALAAHLRGVESRKVPIQLFHAGKT